MKSPALEIWLRDRLRERGLSQQQLAAQAEIAAGMIARIERGHVPSPKVLVKLADFFGEDLGTLLEIAGVLRLADLPEERRAELKNMTSRLCRLPARDRGTILQQIGALLDLIETGWTLQMPESPAGDAQVAGSPSAVTVNLQYSTAT